jgi:hypothetical protein
MTVAVESDVRQTLYTEREVKIARAFRAAWADWLDDPRRHQYRWARTRACIVFEHISARLQAEFADDPGVRFFFQDETIKIVFDDRVLVRCKKADDDGFGQNIPTQAAMTFCDAQGELPGLSGYQKVEILYHLNDVQTLISAITVQARDGDMRLWEYELGAADGAAALPFIPPSVPPPKYDASELVRPRKPGADRDEDSKDR